jgi:hypothetical protein
MKIIILTLSPGASFSRRFLRNTKIFIRNKFFFYGGPQSVLDSLVRGFQGLGVEYNLNPKEELISGAVGVLSDVGALKWAIEAKENGRINKIVAGPNIVISPKDEGEIIQNLVIDVVLAPSQWVKDFWLSIAPALESKIRIWAAGVEIPKEVKTERRGCLVYKKKVNEDLFQKVISELEHRKILYKVINWGSYKQSEYFELLENSKFMIYLQESESQGIALAEAWARNVPTLVWDKGHWERYGYRWEAKGISAPYLTGECGMFFEGENDFVDKLDKFSGGLSKYRPREYVLNNFSDKIASNNYLKIIQND